jgi:uncharacterized membrane protein YgaE (UPF0421/DUF939 family)
MNPRLKSLLVYSAKCITGTIIVFIISRIIHYDDIGWCLISVMLVLSPDGKDAPSLAITRIKANVVGASIAVLCLLISPSNMWILCIALFFTLVVCYLLKLDAGIRSALAATIIIMLHNDGKHLWDTALERIAGVLAGCVLALLITFIFHFKLRPGDKNVPHQQNE